MNNSDKKKIRDLFFKLKIAYEKSPLTRKELFSALLVENVLNSSTLENDFLDPMFFNAALYRGNQRVKDFSNPVYRKIFIEVRDLDRMLRFLEKKAARGAELDVSLFLKIHRILFEKSWPDIAGRFRDTEVRIRGLRHHPPHHSQLTEIIYQHLAWIGGLIKLLGPVTPGNFFEIFHVAADIQRRTIDTYPFRAGNWRIARALSDYVLLHSGMPFNIISKEHREEYMQTLSQASIKDFTALEDFLIGCYGETLSRIISFTKLKQENQSA